jgi:hypothetical protein
LDREIQIKNLEAFNETLTHELMKNHEKLFGEKIRNIRRSLEEMSNVADRLDVAVKNAWGTLDKTTSEQGIRLTETIKESVRELSGHEINPNYASSDKYHTMAVQISNKIVLSIRKYVPKLHRALKTEIAALNSALTKLESSINSLGTALDDSPGRALESLELEIEFLLAKDHATKEIESQNRDVEESIRRTNEEEKDLTNEQNLLLSREEFLRLQRCEDSLKTKTEEIERFLQPLAKPLRKFERALPENTTIDRSTLMKLMKNPSEAISRINPQTIDAIFKELNDAVIQGKLGIEERKRKRALEIIEAVNRGELEKLRTSLHSIEIDTQTATTRLIAEGLFDMKEKLRQQLASRESQIEQLKNIRDNNRKKIEELTKIISKQKSLIESRIANLSGQNIIITE